MEVLFFQMEILFFRRHFFYNADFAILECLSEKYCKELL